MLMINSFPLKMTTIPTETDECARQKASFRTRLFYSAWDDDVCGGEHNRFCMLKFDVTNLMKNCSTCSGEKKMLGALAQCMGTNPEATAKCEKEMYAYRSKYLFTPKVNDETQKIIDYIDSM
jgi:hypothetical protein